MSSSAFATACAGDFRGLADVAIVEADDVEAPCGQRGAEIVVPLDHVRAEAHDEEGGGIGRTSERLVAELDAVDSGDRLAGLQFRHVLLPCPRRA
jgi:hypothetical protein